MNNSELFDRYKERLSENLQLLNDKPEETVYSTLHALWIAASGKPMSVEEAIKIPLPNLSDRQVTLLKDFINQRLSNVPLAHIIGRQSFMGLELITDRRALIPRKETEILGKKALELSLKISEANEKIKVIDVCCGAGNLGLALAHYNECADVYSADLSEEAVQLTKENIQLLNLNDRVHTFQSDLFTAFENIDFLRKTDLIVCNPPYISSAKVAKMNSEISDNEPVLAFDGGMLGTRVILKLISEAPRFLKKSGWLIFEIGLGQGPFIMQLCERSENYDLVDSVADSSNNIRAILARRK